MIYSVKVPGKIIVSGEHSVVYNKPALAMAVNRYTVAESKSIISKRIEFEFSDLVTGSSLSYDIDEIHQIIDCTNNRYQEFIDKKIAVSSVLPETLQLFPYACGLLLKKYGMTMKHGVSIKIETTIPIGCGMGSSASVSLGVLQAFSVQLNVTPDHSELFQLALQCEHLKHGQSSGLDPFVCLHGGLVKYTKNDQKKLAMPNMEFFLVFTGKPQSSTGQCVMSVREKVKNQLVWDQIENITETMMTVMTENDVSGFASTIRENHRLLCDIGVVPDRVQSFIREIEHIGGAAKISGAGSVSGDSAGIVMVVGKKDLKRLCKKYNYALLPIKGDNDGLRCC